MKAMVRMGLQLMVVDTVIKPNRNSVATSLGYEFQGQDKDDDINYVKEVLVYYIEEVEHIIVIGGATLDFFYGLLRPRV
ncbi:uncharacterized protein OCT59_009380 [Rhizophagus irregularis]|nr:hypothetical protein OCT59_009380 [Rhizophagus irregularis]GBC24829.2 hypothetical protein GLOIN_2v1770952 [Rhizophagus irregularis DAOM 181602=DAOM 197198]